jgi:hypothetical protein
MSQLETDYLIISSGATGLAVADTLIVETDAHVTIVDRRGKPGGHWNDAYSFVTLHQPSAFYGVNSMALGSGLKDAVGLNKGLDELASGAEVSGYFDRVMNQRLLPSGRVSYGPLCNYLGDGLFESLLSGQQTKATVRRKTVDATFYSPSIPSTHRRVTASTKESGWLSRTHCPGSGNDCSTSDRRATSWLSAQARREWMPAFS